MLNRALCVFTTDTLAVFVWASLLLYVLNAVDVLVVEIDLVLVKVFLIEPVLIEDNVEDFVCVIDLVLLDELVIVLVEEPERVEVDVDVIVLVEIGLTVCVIEDFILGVSKALDEELELDVSLLLGFWVLLEEDVAVVVLEERDVGDNEGVFVFEFVDLDVNVDVLDCVKLLEDVVLPVWVGVFNIEEVCNALSVPVLELVDVRVDVLECKLVLVKKILLVSINDG